MRKAFKWNVTLQSADGQIVERKFFAYWSPDRDFITGESIARACAAQESAGSRPDHAPISAQLAA